MNIKLVLLDKSDDNISIYKEVTDTFEDKLCMTLYEKSIYTNNFLSIGVIITDVENMKDFRVFIGSTERSELNYNDSGYFYQEMDKDCDIAGMNKAGLFKVFVDDKTGRNVYTSDPILVKPAVISHDMYKEMIKMLLNIHKDLVSNESSSTYLSSEHKNEDDSEKILNFLHSVSSLIYEIDRNPNISLIKEEGRVQYNKVKKITKKLIIEKGLYSFKNKYSSQITKETIDTYENRAIYTSLMEINRIIDNGIYSTSNKINRIIKEINLTRENLEKYQNNNDSYGKKLIVKVNTLKEELKHAQENQVRWTKGKELVSEFLKLRLFKEIKKLNVRNERLKLTQFFMHDIIYGKYYRKAVDLRDVINFELSDCGCEELNINEVYDIFEVWSFFFMIKILVENVNWKSKENKNIIKNANHYMRKNKTLYGFYVDLEHELKDSTASLRIVYNKTIKLENGNLRPDFTFIFNCRNSQKIFYMDAKYHDYRSSDKLFYDDVNNVAVKKYYTGLLNTEYKAQGSYILHCNKGKKFRHFGGNTAGKHKTGSISLTPDNEYDFTTWISMIMEWFYDEYNVCWNCGNTATKEKIEVTMGGKEKYHYECNYCGNFWVKSHCFACACNKIVKHDLQEKQYHLLSGEKWMVKCPQCGDSGVRTALTDTHTANGYISDSRVNNINVKSIKTVNTNVIYNNNRVICSRCRGSGRISRYNHIENGVCFACNGTGYVFSRF